LHDKHAIDARVVFDISSRAIPPGNCWSTAVLAGALGAIDTNPKGCLELMLIASRKTEVDWTPGKCSINQYRRVEDKLYSWNDLSLRSSRGNCTVSSENEKVSSKIKISKKEGCMFLW
jgi:hypothetical protein